MNKIKEFWADWKSHIIMIVVCVFLLFAKAYVLSLFNVVVTWLQPCSEVCFALLVTGFCSVLSLIRVIKIKEKKQQVAQHTIAIEFFFILLYAYFRFINTSYYEFWGPGDLYYKWCDITFLPFVLLLVQTFVCRKQINADNRKTIHLLDRPIKCPNDDLFAYDNMAAGLLSDLYSVDVYDESFSVGVLGIWGQGKSSFLNLFKSHAEEDGAVVVEFYPRASKSIKTIQEDFFDALKGKLRCYHTGIERYITNYAREVAKTDTNWIGKIAIAFNLLSAGKEKDRINRVIRTIGRRIYVIIEDFDRLTGKEILEVLKLLERNGDFCNTIFITAYDKLYVNDVLNHHLGISKYQDYTDKYFDYEYSLPTNNQTALVVFANNYFVENIDLQPNDRINKTELIDAWKHNGAFIVNQLGTLRHVKRFINIFVSRYPKIKNDVDVSDFLLLTLLRYKDLTTYYSLFDMRFLRRGALYASGSPKLIYLQDNYQDILKELNVPSYSKAIIEKLFHSVDGLSSATMDEVYGKLEWADSFYSYFFDYRIGKYHYEDFQRLFQDDEDSAFALLKEMHNNGITTKLEDFLRSRKESWIADEKGLERLLKLIVFLDSINRSWDIEGDFDRMTLKNTYTDYEKAGVVKDEKSYHDLLLNVLRTMMEKYPMEVGFSCHRVTKALFDNQITVNDLIVTPKELKDLSIWAQRYYYQRYEKGDYIFNAILNLAKVLNPDSGDNEEIAKEAKLELVALMKLHPEQFAKDLVVPTVYNDTQGEKYLDLRFNENFDYNKMLSVDDFSIENWLIDYLDEKTSFVINKIYSSSRKMLHLSALKQVYEPGDFEGFYEAIKAQKL